MDDRRGNFQPIDEDKFQAQLQQDLPMVFKEGEILKIQQSRFRIERIEPKGLRLKLLGKMGPEAFERGAILTIRGSKLRIVQFRKKILILKLQPQEYVPGFADRLQGGRW